MGEKRTFSAVRVLDNKHIKNLKKYGIAKLAIWGWVIDSSNARNAGQEII